MNDKLTTAAACWAFGCIALAIAGVIWFLRSRLGVRLRADHIHALVVAGNGVGLLLVAILIVSCQPANAWQPPAESSRYQRELTRIVQQEWGLPAPVAIHAAQIQQESGWRADAESPAGAEGLSQFMPSTSEWIAEIYPDLGAAAPYSPTWAMRAQSRYNRWHWQRIDAADICSHWALTLSAYNGGLGWVYRDQRLARAADDDPSVWFGHVERYTNRADWARTENRDYVDRILLQYTPRYAAAGWQGGSPCYL